MHRTAHACCSHRFVAGRRRHAACTRFRSRCLGSVNAPSVDAAAPYTPAVLSLIAQLEPTRDADARAGAEPRHAAPRRRQPRLPQRRPRRASLRPRRLGQRRRNDARGRGDRRRHQRQGDERHARSASARRSGSTRRRTPSRSRSRPSARPDAAAPASTSTAPLTKAHANGRPAYVTLTTPSISYICWTDAQGVLNTSGPNARGSTAPMTLMGLGATFDRSPRQRLGPDRGRREPRLHGHRHVRPADRPRPAAELGPQPDHDRRGPVPQPPARRRADQRHAGRRARCRR